MGTPRQILRLLAWTLLSVGLTVAQQEQQQVQQSDDDHFTGQQSKASRQAVNIIPPLSKKQMISGVSPAHNGQVCSTWGNYHFNTFDGDVFQVPSTCNFVLSSLCKSDYEEFNIQMRRQVVNGLPTISKITMKLDGTVVELLKGSILINKAKVKLPFSQFGVLIELTPAHIKITSKLGLVAMWNEDDSFLMEMDMKFKNQTCGLCGDFNGVQYYNEFLKEGAKLSVLDFANIWRMDSPTEDCEEPALLPRKTCKTAELKTACEQLLSGRAFSNCQDLVDSDYFLKACISDLCHCDQSSSSFCLCNTISEYSRQCVHAGGRPQQWRTQQFCSKSCPFNMEYQECGTPCIDTCTNPERSQLCEEHCTDGCFCPPGTIFDDIKQTGCIKVEQCSCTYNGRTYSPGESYRSRCTKCTCSGGEWSCQDLECAGTCSVEGGSHITTFDGKAYSINGQCSFVLAKQCKETDFTVLADIEKCGLTDTETCLKAVIIRVPENIISIQPNGGVLVNNIAHQLPLSTDQVTVFKPSTFYVIVQTSYGLQLRVQLVPVMQVYITLNPSNKGTTCGLCGNFNNVQADDFKSTSGLVEGTGAAFANTWKARASCTDVKSSFENPCSLSVENEQYAQYWCSMLTDPKGVFAKCHSEITPESYKAQCMHDSCNCEKSEDCMCAALSSYVYACAVKGIKLKGWRDTACKKYTTCPSTMVFAYSMTNCKRTCRSLSEPDYTCQVDFLPVDGCGCAKGTYMNQENQCVPPTSCPCYYKGAEVPPGETVIKNGATCTCKKGKLSCFGAEQQLQKACLPPMVFFNCEGAKVGTVGSECQRSCSSLNMECISTDCISGCVCPEGLVSDGKGGCIEENACPCIHNGAPYQPGSKIKVSCNTCTCKSSKWQCTSNDCHGTCAIYGDGNYITFDDKRFSFSGGCEYTLTQDYCSKSGGKGTFRVITENVPCGTTGTTCSKAIKLFLGSNELILTEGKSQVIQRDTGGEIPYQIRTMGIYLVVEANNGLILMWDKKTSMFIKLSKKFTGRVCGLCGNYDGDGNNDFTTRSQAVVVNSLEFGNSWKVAPSCPDAELNKDPCTSNPYRQSWSQKQCSIINSKVFSACHSQVDAGKYFDVCVSDSCACDSGGDCECFCTAVAAYAQACNEAGVCVPWRSPQICPLFCDFYNGPDGCEWHYKPCGAPCVKTCKNPSGICSNQIPALEGCYPKCPADKPYLDEATMKCVPSEQCGCYDEEGNHYTDGESVPSTKNCDTCYCAMTGVLCHYDVNACYCTYKGNKYPYGSTVYNTTDGDGSCITAVCGKNGTIERDMYPCATTTTAVPTTSPETTESTSTPMYTTATPTTVFVFSTTEATSATTEKGREPVTPTTPIITMSEGTTPKYATLPQVVTTAKTTMETKSTPVPQTPTAVKTTPSRTASTTTKKPVSTTEKILTETTKPPTKPTTGPITETFTTTPISEVTTSTTKAELSTPFVSTSAPIRTTPCIMCKWSNWIDTNYPTSGPDGGDTESIGNIVKSENNTCTKPTEVECRGKQGGLSITDLGQKVECSPSVGLICKNKDQTPQMCYNYEIRLKCCEDKCKPQTPSTTVHKTTILIETSTTQLTLPTTTKKPVSTTEKILTETTKPPTETTTGPITETFTTTPMIEITTSTTKAEITTPVMSPKTSTVSPVVTSSRPSISTETTPVPQTSTEVKTTPSRTASTTTKKPVSTTEKILTETTKPPTKPTTGPITETFTTTPISEVTTSTTKAELSTPFVSTSAPIRTTPCIMCKWSNWIDTNYPTSGPDGGDTESIGNIVKSENNTCTKPTEVECRGKQGGLSITDLGQKVECSPSVGLICKNKDQTPQMCYNYEIRLKCCEDKCKPQTPSTTVHKTTILIETSTTQLTLPTTTKKPVSTTEKILTETTKPPTETTTGPITETFTTTPMIEITTSTTKAEITTPVMSPKTSTVSPVVTSSRPSISTETTPVPQTSTEVKTTPSRTASTTTKKPVSTTEKILTETTKPPTKPTTGPITETFTTTPISEVTTSTTKAELSTPFVSTSAPIRTTPCIMCKWSNWIDTNYPTSGPDGGDTESIGNIVKSENNTCTKPTEVECRGKQGGLSITDLGQKVECSPSVGLICKNKDQTPQMCYNYEIRLKCCEDKCKPQTPSTTVHKTTILIETSTTQLTLPTTTKKPVSTTEKILTETTKPPTETTTGPITETFTTTPMIEITTSTTKAEITTPVMSPKTSTVSPVVTSSRPSISTETTPVPQTSTEVKTTPSRTASTTTKKPVSTTEKILTETTKPPTKPTTGPITETFTTTPISEVTTSTTKAELSTPFVSTSAPIRTTPCIMCKWSNWIDTNYPTSGPDGGDTESIGNIVKSENNTCTKPTEVECRGKQGGLSITDLGQKVECSPSVGLICKNKDQTPQMCYNYEIRLKCCEDKCKPQTPSTTVHKTTILIETSTTQLTLPTTTKKPVSTTEKILTETTKPPTETTTGPITETFTTTPMIEITTSTTKAEITTPVMSPKTSTVSPVVTSSRPSISTETTPVPQTSTEVKTTPSRTASTTTKKPVSTTEKILTETTKPPTKPTTGPITETFTTTPISEVTTSTTKAELSTPFVSTSAPIRTTPCIMCKWSNWIDTNYPTSGPDGGDTESIGNIVKSENNTCTKPTEVECRGKQGGLSITDLGQKVECSPSVGLICKNKDQTPQMCYNYEIRLKCCEDKCKPQTPSTTVHKTTILIETSTTQLTLPTTTKKPVSTTEKILTETTKPPTETTTGPITETFTTTPMIEITTSTTKAEITTPVMSPKTSTVSPVVTSSRPSISTETTPVPQTSTEVKTTPSRTASTTTKKPVSTTEKILTETTKPPTKPTTGPITETFTTTPISEVTTSTTKAELSTPFVSTSAPIRTTPCIMCKWSNWIDTNYPTSGPDGGDTESIGNIVKSENNTCTKPTEVECRGKQGGLSITDLGQKVECSPSVGLICKNKDQTPQMCYNYEIRLKCCEDKCKPQTPSTTVHKTTILIETSTTQLTLPTTTKKPVSTTEKILTETTKPPTETTTGPITETFTTTPMIEITTSTTKAEITTPVMSPKTSTVSPVVTSSRPSISTETTPVPQTSTEVKTTPSRTASTTTKKPVSTTEKILTETTKPPTKPTTGPITETFTTTPISEVTTSTTKAELSTPFVSTSAPIRTTPCIMCKWSNWIDTNYPTSGPDGGDTESIGNIVKSENNTCTKPTEVECRGKQGGLSITDLGQKVECSPSVGLICKNKDQTPQMCYNYEIRLKCCEDKCKPQTPSTTVHKTTILIETSTTQLTLPTTTKKPVSTTEKILTETTKPPTETTTGPITETFTTTPMIEITTSTTKAEITTPVMSPKTSTVSPVVTSSRPSISTETTPVPQTSTEVKTTPSRTASTTTKKPVSTTEKILTETTKPPTKPTTGPITETFTTTPISEVTTSTTKAELSTPFVSTSAPIRTTPCIMCKWSNWIDTNYPTSGPDGGDTESIGNIVKSENNTCTKPTEVECRGKQGGLSITDLGQKVECSPSVGLICKNKDQTPQMCYNYEIRLKCCEDKCKPQTPSTTVHKTTILIETSTTQLTLPTTTKKPVSTTEKILTETTKPPTETTTGPITETFTTTPMIEITTSTTKAEITTPVMSPKTSTVSPVVTSSRPSISTETTPVPQTSTEVKTTPSRTASTTTKKPVSTTEKILTETTKPPTKPTTGPITETFTTTPISEVTTSTTKAELSTPFVSTSAPIRTTPCIMCKWSNWIDTNYPTSGPDGGDTESIGNIVKSENNTCTKPTEVECRGKQGGLSITDLGQKVECSPSVGLICKNKDQTPQMCYNYEIRLKCCEDKCKPQTPSTTVHKTTILIETSTTQLTLPTTTKKPVSTTEKILTETTKPPTETTTGPITETFTTTPMIEITTSTTKAEITTPVMSPKTSTVSPVVTSSRPSISTETTPVPQTSTEVKTTPSRTASTTTKKPVSTTEKILTETTKPPTKPTTGPITETFTTTPISEVTTSTTKAELSTPFVSTSAPIRTTPCIMCKWSNWIDTNYPTSGPDGGDTESIGNIVKSENNTCTKPTEVECRGKQGGLSITDLGQKVECSPSVGLICKNKDQTPQMCYNYEIRLKCCEDKCKPQTPSTTVHKTTILIETSTTQLTLPTTTKKPVSTTEKILTETTKPPTETTTGPITETFTTTPMIEITTSTTKAEITTPVMSPKTSTVSPVVTSSRPSISTETTPVPQTSTEVKTTPSRTASTTTKKPVSTTEKILTETTKPPTKPTTGPITETFTTTPISEVTTSTTKAELSTPFVSTSAPIRTTPCIMCKWSNWIDTNYPTSGPDGGDTESIGNIVKSENNTCTKPTEVECRGKQGGLSITDLGQKVECSPSVGLICKNKDQTPQMCYNYEIRLKCCEDKCKPQTPSTTVHKTTILIETSTTQLTLPTTTKKPVSTTEKILTETTKPPTETTTGPITETFTTTPMIEITTSTTKAEITTPVMSPKTSTVSPVVTSSRPSISTETTPVPQTSTEVKTTPSRTASTTTKKPVSTTEKILTETTKPPTKPTTGPITETFTTTPISEVTTSTTKAELSTPFVSTSAPIRTTPCIMCKWSNWIDTNYPTSGPDGGDTESIGNIVKSENNTCTKPTEVECRGKQGGLSITDLGQKVECSPSVGLICKNKDQTPQMCYNYEIRLKCCEDKCKPQTPSTTVHKTTILIETSTTQLTLPTTTKKPVSTTEKILTETTKPPTETTTGPITETFTTTPMIEITTSTTKAEITTPVMSPKTSTVSPVVTSSRPSISTETTPVPQTSTEVKTTPSRTASTTTKKPVSTTEKILTETTKPPTKPTTGPITETFTTTPISEVTTSTTKAEITTPVMSPKTSTVSPVVTSSRPSISTETTVVPPTPTEVTPKPTHTVSTAITMTMTMPVVSGTSTTPKYTTGPVILTTSTSIPISTTLQCVCIYKSEEYPRGSIIYNETDGEGWCFSAYCNATCNIEKQSKPCLTTVSPPVSTTIVKTATPASTLSSTPKTETPAIVTTTSPKSTTLVPGCYHFHPPRKNGESWNIGNCTKATCTDGTAILTPKECEPVEPVVCENGHSPIRVYDESGCCFHYECEYCFGPNDTTKEPGEKWESNCQECECPMDSTIPLCKPLECSILPNKTCDKPGQVPVIETVDCCKKVTCECNVDTCPETNHTCSEGFKPIIITPKGSCCPEYDCQPKPVCVHKKTEYQPGASVPTDKCEECKCSSTVDPETKLHSVECTPMKCDENCQLGSEYEAVPGECCGKCVEKSCVVTLPDDKTQIIEPGQIWTPPGEKCDKYKCEKIEDQLVPVQVKIVCPEFNPENCVPHTEKTGPDGCCKTCTPRNDCKVLKNSTYLVKDGCKSTEPVEINSCEGTCTTSSMYSLQANTMMHACSCCQEMSTSSKQVEMICPDGTKTNYTYTYIETCGCELSECTENQASKKGARRRRR